MSELTAAPLQVIWDSRGSECYAAYSELFDPPPFPGVTIIDRHEGDDQFLPANGVTREHILSALQRGEALRVLAYDFFGRDLLPLWQVDERTRMRLREMRPNSEVRHLIGSVPKTRLGIHIRMTDHLPCRFVTPRWCYRVLLRQLATQFPGEPVFICSDTPCLVDSLQAEFPQVVSIRSPLDARHDVRHSVAGVQVALAQLWRLAHCEFIFAPPCSTFSRVAANLGGCSIYQISSAPPRSRNYAINLGWKLWSNIAYDAKQDRWRPSASQTRALRRSKAQFAATLASIICGRLYQDRAAPLQRHLLTRSLREFLARGDVKRN